MSACSLSYSSAATTMATAGAGSGAASSTLFGRHSHAAILTTVHHHLLLFLSDRNATHAVSRRCLALLSVATRGPFDAALSGLCTAIERILDLSAEPSVLEAIEAMLQAPALLEEDGLTAGVDNRFIISCAYFYLAVVSEMQGDRWQSAMHFLQAAMVSPRAVRVELLPALWDSLFGGERDDEASRQMARKYRDSLMYYRVVFSGDAGRDRGGQSSKHSVTVGHYRRYNPATVCMLAAYPDHPENSRDKATTLLATPTKVDLLQTERSDGYDMRCLQEILEDSQSDTAVSFYSHADSEEAHAEVNAHGRRRLAKIMPVDPDYVASEVSDSCHNQKLLTLYPSIESESDLMIYAPECGNEDLAMSSRSDGTPTGSAYSVMDADNAYSHAIAPHYANDGWSPECSPTRELRCLSTISSKFMKRSPSNQLVTYGSIARKFSGGAWSDTSSYYDRDVPEEFVDKFEKAISTLRSSEGLQDADTEVSTIWEALNIRVRVQHSLVKQDILEQLFESIAASKKEKVIRASVCILLLMIAEDRNIVRNIKRKDLYLHNLAAALTNNVHEAAILIYLLNPSPAEIKRLELLPSLLKVACSPEANRTTLLLPLTPTSASIAMIELLVTAYDYVTNNMHLSAISSPDVLGKLVNVAKNNNLEEGIALAGILVRCVRLSGNCKRFLSQVTPVIPFLHLLRRKDPQARCAALHYFHEIIKIPRSSAIPLLREIQQQGGISIMHTLVACVHQTGPEERLLAANLLLQLDMLENSNRKSVFREEAMEILLVSMSSEANGNVQALAASLLSSLGGTYSWEGEPYAAAYLLKKLGLSSVTHRNMIRNVDWLDPCLQDAEASSWSTKIARRIIRLGVAVFGPLSKGMKSKNKAVSRDCLICSSWLGSEMATLGENKTRFVACEALIEDVSCFLHPGSELDERVLACASVYNYTSGKGKQKLMNFSEGVRESLRRLSSITWMAEELLRVTNYFLPSKPRVSCVHTQILEIGYGGNAAVLAMVFFRGQLFAAHNDGTIRSWSIKGNRAVLAWEVKEHKKAVTCFALFEPQDYLLSGSSDKTIRVWKMVCNKLECVDVVQIKEAALKLDIYGDKIVVLTKSSILKVTYTSRAMDTLYKNRYIRDIAVAQGKAYLGCANFSIQEIDLISDIKTEIRAPEKSWGIKRQPVNSVAVYKDSLYCAGALVESSTIKDWRRRCGPRASTPLMKGSDVQAMSVVEDFIYLSSSKNSGVLQIWLREKQQKVGRLSAGSKITSLLTANDAVYCGTEIGIIKAWMPL